MKQKRHIYFWAMGSHGSGISGGDRIYIELAKRWSNYYPITIVTTAEGVAMMKRQQLVEGNTIKFHVLSIAPFDKLGFLGSYIGRIIVSIMQALFFSSRNNEVSVVYSASEFWMDSFAAFILKLKGFKWVATWFQTAPNPIQGFKEGERLRSYRFSALLYWLVQLPVKPLVAFFADLILVNNESERSQFPKAQKEGQVSVLIGAVHTDVVDQYTSQTRKKKYDAVFQGRFHAQKGVGELVLIWKEVVKVKKDAILVMIGDGPLMGEVKDRIVEEGLEKNIILTGYLFDGEEKYNYFAQSTLVLHPAFYDSGGMAAAEAMMFGLPCVAFDLKAYSSYYPKGIMKVKIGDITQFAQAILELLNNKNKREKLGNEAKKLMKESYSWDFRADQILNEVKKIL